MKKTNKKTCFLSKWNNDIKQTKFDFIKHYWKFLVGAVSLALVGVIVLCCVNFNKGMDFTGGTQINVEIGSYLNEENDYNYYELGIKEILNNNNISSYSLTSAGEGTTASIIIKYQSIAGISQEDMNAVSQKVVDNLFEKYNVEKDLSKIWIEDYKLFDPVVNTNNILFTVLIVSIVSLLMIIYFVIRYDFASGVTCMVMICLDVLVMLALTAITRIQISQTFLAMISASVIYTIINFIVMATSIKADKYRPTNEKLSDNAIVKMVLPSMIPRIIVVTLIFVMLSLLLFAISAIRSTEISVIMIFIALSTCYTSATIAAPLWARLNNNKRKAKKISDNNNDAEVEIIEK